MATTKVLAEEIADLFNHGLTDFEICERLDVTNEELIAVLRQVMTEHGE